MDANAQLQRLIRPMPDPEVLHGLQQMQGHGGHLAGVVVAVADGQSTGHHVGVADGLHLVHVVLLDDAVKQRVQVVEKIHHLQPESTSAIPVPPCCRITSISCPGCLIC